MGAAFETCGILQSGLHRLEPVTEADLTQRYERMLREGAIGFGLKMTKGRLRSG